MQHDEHCADSESLMDKKFDIIVLGSSGSVNEDNLTAYLVAPKGSNDFLAVDAGRLFSGLKKANAKGSFDHIHVPEESSLSTEGWILQECVKAYLISHAHLDHVAGLIINSTDDCEKEILGFSRTIDYLRDHIFNWKIWPNFGDEGVAPHMNKYRYVRLEPGKEYPITATAIKVIPFTISHSVNYESAAFLIEADDHFILIIGDTSPDPIGRSEDIEFVWNQVTPLIKNHKLRAIFLETSYPDEQADEALHGHLTPYWMIHELGQLAKTVNPQHPDQALALIPIVVTSIKPALDKAFTKELVSKQLNELNKLSLKFIIPSQGELLQF